jgi:hypothetical protein
MKRLSLLLLFVPSAAFAEGSMMASTLQGMTGALNDVNSAFSAYGASAGQLQQLAAQLSQAQQQANGQQQPQGAFDQIQKQLSLVMAEANACVMQNSNTNYDKYYAKRPASQKDLVKNISPDALTSVEPTCTTYGVILDAIELQKARMSDANKRMACLVNMQQKVNQIAEAAKAPFQQLNTAANEVYKTYSGIIDAHNQIADKIANDVDGAPDKDGKRSGGYRGELNKLKGMALELNNVLNAKQGENGDSHLKYGLVKQVENLKKQRTDVGNKWYFTMMNEIDHCFYEEPAACFDNDVQSPPGQCIGAMINNNAVGSDKGAKARARTDANGLNNLRLKTYIGGQKVNTPTNLDMANPDAVVAFVDGRFEKTLRGVLGAYGNHQFSSRVPRQQMLDYIANAYQNCKAEAEKNFRDDLRSKGPRYYADVIGMQDMERETANDEKNWIDRIEGEMTTFRTQFQKVYNSDLAQFKSDCTDDGDPYKGLDCMRVLNAQLQSGMRGTRVSAKLGNGTTYTATAGETSLPIQTLTLDQQGKATIGSSSVKCSGFDDCINFLDRAREQHASAAQTSENDRKKFVDQHNQATRQAFDVVAQQFSQLSQLITASVKGVNDDLVKLGIKATVKTKQIEAEELKENEKTGLFDMPKSMKAALAGRNSFTEVDDTKDVTDAYNSMLTELNKKAGEAQKQKRLCQVDANSYKGLVQIMPSDCSNTYQVCDRDRIPGAATYMEPLFKRSVEKVDENARNNIAATSEYKSCVSSIKADVNADLDDDAKLEDYAASHQMPSIFKNGGEHDGDVDSRKRANVRNRMKADLGKTIRKNSRQDCGDFVLGALAAEANASRDTLREQNSDIVEALKAVSTSCSEVEVDEKGKMKQDSEVTEKCEAYKRVVGDAKAPEGEAETGALAGTSNNAPASASSIFNSGTAK